MNSHLRQASTGVHLFCSWLVTFPFLFTFGSILLVFDPVQRVALKLNRRCHELVVVALNASILRTLQLTGMRLTISGHIPNDDSGPVIVVANHQSMFDIPILHTIFKHLFPRFIAKQELARWIPSISYNLRHGENALIDRKNPLQSTRAIGKLAKMAVERGCAVVLFPEGTRARRGATGKFHIAGLRALLSKMPNATIVPVALSGSWKLGQHKLFPVPWRTQVTAHICPPLTAQIQPGRDADFYLRECEAQIRQALKQN